MITTIPIAEFKTNCHKIIEQAQLNQQKVTLTKNGKPIATIAPIGNKILKPSIVGMLVNKAHICGDILNTDTRWDAEHE